MPSAAVEEGQNAIDAIVRAALALLDRLPEPGTAVDVLVEGEAVAVDGDGTFAVRPGVEVVCVSGSLRTAQRTPCDRPVPLA